MAQPEQYIIHFTDPSKSSFIVSPYTTNGRTFPTSNALDSQAISAASSLLLYGKGSANYGERIQENILHILENFSGSTAPTLPISGQSWFSRKEYWRSTGGALGWWRWNDSTPAWESLTVTEEPSPGPAGFDGQYWFNTTNETLNRRTVDANHPLNNTWIIVTHTDPSALNDGTGSAPTVNDTPEKSLKVYNGESWVPVSSSAFASASAPYSPLVGDLWFDTDPSDDVELGLKQLKVWDGITWVSSGGNYVLITGDSMTGDLTMTTSNINIDEGQGLVSNVLGSPLGDGATLLLSSGGLDWETVGGFTIKNSASATVLTVGVGGATLSTFAGDIQMSGNEVLGLPALPSGSTAATSRAYVDTLIGGTPASIDDLLDVYVPTPSHNEFLYYDNVGSPSGQWKNKLLSPSDIGVSASTADLDQTSGVTSNIQTQLDAKANKNNAALTGTPTTPNVTPGDSSIKIANTAFVQNALTGAGGGADGVLQSATWDPSSYLLTLTKTTGIGSPATSDVLAILSHTHDTTEITHAVSDSLMRDNFLTDIAYPNVNVDVLIQRLSYEIKNRMHWNEHMVLQQVFRPTSSQTVFELENDEEYITGFNRIQVFVNGVKQIGDGRARQGIYFNSVFNVSTTSPTGLPNDATAYSFTVAVDASATGSPQSPTTVNITGSQVQTVQGIIDQINAQVSGVTAIFNKREVAIFVFSNISGTGSAVDVVDVDFFSALSTATGSPVDPNLPIYAVNNILPSYPSAITQITDDGAYYEADEIGSPATYGQVSAGLFSPFVVFNTAVPSGAVVEFLIT